MAASTNENDDDDGFKIVVRKSKKTSKMIHKNVGRVRYDQQDESHLDLLDIVTIERRILSAKDEVLLSDFLETFKDTLKLSAIQSHSSQMNADDSIQTNPVNDAKNSFHYDLCTARNNDDKTIENTSDRQNHDRIYETNDHNHEREHCTIESSQKEKFSENVQSSRSCHDDGACIQSVVCYGLGNFSSCVIARYQLAFLIVLIDLLKVPHENCQVYDPVFTQQEQEILTNFGFSVIHQNEEGKRPTSTSTLFYMPHCGKPLYNNLLWANWGMQLNKITIIGNSFSNICERIPSRQLMKVAPYILKAQRFTKECKLKNNFNFQDIFNDLAIHTFPRELLHNISASTWKDHEEPRYEDQDDVEIICSQQPAQK